MQYKSNAVVVSVVAVVLAAGIGLPMAASALEDDNRPADTSTPSQVGALVEKYRQQALSQNKTLRTEQIKARTQEQRQKSCEARKEGLARRMDRAVTQAEKHKAVFDKIYTRVMKFHDDKNLNTPNYDELLSTMDSAQSDAASSIAALSSLNLEIDCTQDNVADGVSTFKEALRDTRDSLKAYRKSIVELIKAVHQSFTESNDNNNNSQPATRDGGV